MVISSNGNIFRVTGPLWGESNSHRWIPLTKASDAELWSFPWSTPEKKKQLSKQSRRWWFETTPHSLWCHCNVITLLVLILEYCLKTKSITWRPISKLLWHQVTCNHGINPLRAKFFRGNINIYLHFLSLHHIDMTQIVEILPRVRQGPIYSI